jgi:hypothetical protein
MVRQLKGIIVGAVENMACFETPDGERYEIFGLNNGPELLEMMGGAAAGAVAPRSESDDAVRRGPDRGIYGRGL